MISAEINAFQALEHLSAQFRNLHQHLSLVPHRLPRHHLRHRTHLHYQRQATHRRHHRLRLHLDLHLLLQTLSRWHRRPLLHHLSPYRHHQPQLHLHLRARLPLARPGLRRSLSLLLIATRYLLHIPIPATQRPQPTPVCLTVCKLQARLPPALRARSILTPPTVLSQSQTQQRNPANPESTREAREELLRKPMMLFDDRNR